MKTLRHWACVGLVLPLLAVAASCAREDPEPAESDPASDPPPQKDSQSVGAYCRPPAAHCYANWQCCSGYCDGDRCGYGGGGGGGNICRPLGQACFVDNQCCTDNCVNGVCKGGDSGCRSGGQWCSHDSMCCSDDCRNGYCRP